MKGSDGGPAPTAAADFLCLSALRVSTYLLCEHFSQLGQRDTVHYWGKRFCVSISNSDTQSSFVCQKILGYGILKPLPDVSPGGEEFGFQTDFTSSAGNRIPRIVRSGYIHIPLRVYYILL